jgi:tRNA(Ile)-lysidine synthase
MVNLPKGLNLKKNYNKIILSRTNHNNPIDDYKYSIQIPGKIFIKEISGSIETIILKDLSNYKLDRNTQIFDFDKLIGNLEIRKRKDGDTFSPRGMKGTKKLKKYFIDEKIPKEERNKMLLV